VVNQELDALSLTKHPDKTFIGRKQKGFDFLGYHFGQDGLRLADKTIKNYIQKARKLYETEPLKSRARRLYEYTTRWLRWTKAGLES